MSTRHQANQRQAQLRRTTKLLGSDVLRFRAEWPAFCRQYHGGKCSWARTLHRYAREQQQRLAHEGLVISSRTIVEIVRRQSWVTVQ